MTERELSEWIADRLKQKFSGQELTPATANAVADALRQITADLPVYGEIIVSIDPDKPGTLIITGTGDYARWMREAEALDDRVCPVSTSDNT